MKTMNPGFALARSAVWAVCLAWSVGCASAPPKPVTVSQAPALPGAELAAAGFALAAKGDDFGAEQYLLAAVAAGYPEGPVTRAMIKSCVAGGRLESALAHGQSYVDRHPEDWIFNHVIASIHFAKGDSVMARQAIEMVIADHPGHAESQYLYGVIMRDQVGDMVRARDAFEQYLSLEPNGSHAGEVRAWVRRARSFPVAVNKVKRR